MKNLKTKYIKIIKDEKLIIKELDSDINPSQLSILMYRIVKRNIDADEPLKLDTKNFLSYE